MFYVYMYELPYHVTARLSFPFLSLLDAFGDGRNIGVGQSEILVEGPSGVCKTLYSRMSYLCKEQTL
jgi:hypothetical protein